MTGNKRILLTNSEKAILQIMSDEIDSRLEKKLFWENYLTALEEEG